MSGLYFLPPVTIFPGDYTYITMEVLQDAAQAHVNEDNPSTAQTTSTESTEQA